LHDITLLCLRGGETLHVHSLAEDEAMRTERPFTVYSDSGQRLKQVITTLLVKWSYVQLGFKHIPGM